MSPFDRHTVRPATDADADTLTRLARLGRRHPLGGRILVAELDGVPVAAMSIDEQRLVVDPVRSSPFAVMALRTRAAF
jgi:hypothetical protein